MTAALASLLVDFSRLLEERFIADMMMVSSRSANKRVMEARNVVWIKEAKRPLVVISGSAEVLRGPDASPCECAMMRF